MSTPGLGMIIAAAMVLSLMGQDAPPAPIAIDTVRVSIAGTSNLHAYTASTTTVWLTRVEVAGSVAGAGFWDEIVKPDRLEIFEIAIPADSLSASKGGFDHDLHKALKVEQYPQITFRLRRFAPGTGGGTGDGLNAIGILTIAGLEREVTLALTTERAGGGLLVKGDTQIVMTDFGITPPKAMLGMLKTDPKVTVTFEMRLKRA
jgi:hypothetical protein